jgi:hypothetical protein
VVSRPAAGGGRWVDVDPERLGRWLAGFAERHGAVTTRPLPGGLALAGADGAEAECHLLTGAADDVEGLIAAARRPVRFGLLLVRRGGFAVGVARGDTLETSKVDSRYVQGRTAAGGWSQQRFARRRDNQTRQAWQSAAEAAGRVLLPVTGQLAALVGGGDRRAVDAVLAEPRLAPLAAHRVERFLDVPEPRLAVLEQAVTSARTVRIKLTGDQS